MRRMNPRRLVATMAILVGLAGGVVGSAVAPAGAAPAAKSTHHIHNIQMRPADWWWGP